jgi:beta-glucosidase
MNLTTTWMGVIVIAALFAAGTWAQPTSVPANAIYKNPAEPVQRRVDGLLSQMTLEEKVQQLRCLSGAGNQLQANGTFNADRAATLLGNGMGQVAPADDDAEHQVALLNAIQKYLMEQTRLGIPAILHDEACHGFRTTGASSFPTPIGLACSWDPALFEQIFDVVGGEMRARGVSQALAPVVDICRDPRWGRTDETLGEDPYLNGKLGAAMVRGLQGSADGTIAPGHVAATLKHFAGHGAPQSGINRAPNDVSLREMYDAHLVPFRIAIQEAHPAAIMPAYTEVNGVPAHNNPWLLQDVLRKQWQYDGLVVSDYDGVEYLASVHAVAADGADAAKKALMSGVDCNLPAGAAYRNLTQLVQEGNLAESYIDSAVRRVLALKFAMGLFENPYGDAEKAVALANLESSKALGRKAAQESIVLLKNANDVLPLTSQKYHTIAVIGPNAASARLGSYSGDPLYKISVLDGIKKRAGDAARVVWAEGCKIITNLPESSYQAWNRGIAPQYPAEEETRASIAEAVKVAKDADVIVLVLGENEVFSREAWAANHLGDRAELDLPGPQSQLADAIFALDKPVVVYLMNGRPLAIPNIIEKADAVLEGWYMGQETGSGAADIIFGDVNPSGKLTITVPRSVGQLPVYYDAKPGARIYNYVDETNKPLFPFGFGLSYTTFDYATPTLSAATIRKDGKASISTVVTNTGAVAGDEIVQFYIRQRVSSVTRPIKELRGFQRITLKPGESKTVVFGVTRDTLAFHDVNMNYTVEAADFDLMIGPNSAVTKRATLRVSDE